MIGNGLFQITINHGYLVQILAAEVLFTSALRKKPLFSVRFAVGTIFYASAAIVLPNLISHYVAGVFSLAIFLLSLLLWIVCLDGSFHDILFCCVGAQLTQNLAHNVENLFYQPISQRFNLLTWFFLSLTVTVVVYTLCYLLFARRITIIDEINIDNHYVYALSIATMLFIYAMQFLFQAYHIDTLWVTRPPLILCCIAGLCVQFDLVTLKNERGKRRLLEKILEKERHQYEITRNSMDVINRKAHDLKHQIALMRATGTCDLDELCEIESAIAEYESGSYTGCKPLDVILSEKRLMCQRYNIQLNVMAQGEALRFLQPAEVASLFGNILDNAIECEQGIEPSGCRCIGLTVFSRGGFTCIRGENYCLAPPQLVNGLPLSSKGDHAYHGFGLRSVQYITHKYGGSMHIGMEGKLFVISLLLPAPKDDKNT